MSKYLLIESRDLFETNEVSKNYEIATSLANAGNQVSLYLVQNGVLSARSGAARAGSLEAAVNHGVEVLADDFSLKERAIVPESLISGVTPASIDLVVDHLADGHKTIWL